MKRGMVLMLTLVLMAAMAVTTANAQQYVHTDTLTGHTSSVWGIAFKDNGTLISGSSDDTLRAWNVTTGTQRWSKNVWSDVFTVALPSHNPHFIAYGGRGNFNIRMRYSEDGDRRGEVGGIHTLSGASPSSRTVMCWRVGVVTTPSASGMWRTETICGV